jgi:SAM-dependent methyltransferase
VSRTRLRQQRSWDDLARLDPFWAVLARPDRRHGRWDQSEFFATGTEEVARILLVADSLGLARRRGTAVDFGCGVGRLTRALGSRFDRAVGLDISPQMVERATALGADRSNCESRVLPDRCLPFPDQSVDLVSSIFVFQHLEDRPQVRQWIKECIRILDPAGVAVFQIPEDIPPRHRLQPRPRLYALLRRFGVPSNVLYRRFGLDPIRMLHIPREAVMAIVRDAGGEVRTVLEDDASDLYSSATFYVARRVV